MPVVMHQNVIDRELELAADRWADKVGRRITNTARRLCPVDQGALRASIDYAVLSTGTRSKKVVVGSPLPYAAWVHNGTGIYGPRGTRIVPVTAKALKFTPKGSRGVVFRKSVAGVPPRPFLARAIAQELGYLATFRTNVDL